MKRYTRRDFIKTSASLAAACGLTELAGCSKCTEPEKESILTRPLGQTGYNVTIFGLGGQAALERPNQRDLAQEIITRALDLGVNYIDTSAYYGTDHGSPGTSERNIGLATQSRRDSVFLTSKSLSRSQTFALRDLDQSLKNLKTDHVDLWLMHNVRTSSEVSNILSPRGPYPAYERAKNEGMTRFIGFSGHYDPTVMRDLIRGREFDVVLMAVNAADVHEKSFVNIAIPEAVERKMGIVAMKVPARGRLFQEGGVTTMEQALRYTLTHPVSTAIIGCDNVEQVEENVELAKNFKPYSAEEMSNLEDLTASYHEQACWFKTDR